MNKQSNAIAKTTKVGGKLQSKYVASAAVLGMAAACFGPRAVAQATPLNVDVRRSLAVTDLDILARFPLERVMNQLATLSGVPGLTGIEMFAQWWDTQNTAAGGAFTGIPHCDDTLVSGVPSINGFPYNCRPAPHEGRHALCTSFSDPDCAYLPIGLFNRFDLAAQDGSTCGEHRIIYAKATGVAEPRDRNLIIFEAAIPNPTPEAGLNGCRPLIERWAQLSSMNSIQARGNLLEQMYFDGVGTSIPAIVQPAHYGDNPAGRGQIRTNQFMGFTAVTPRVWDLREFKLQRDCTGGGSPCNLVVVPAPNAVNAFGPLFSGTSALPQKAAFDAFFPSQVSALNGASIAAIGMDVPMQFNSAQSHSSGPSNEMNYPLHFTGASALRTAVDSQLSTLGSSLTSDDIVKRAQAMTCAGCHRLSDNANLGGGLTWPASLVFTHVTERQTETVGGQQRYLISPALIDSFLPHRKLIMENFLTGAPLPPVPPGLPIGGRPVH